MVVNEGKFMFCSVVSTLTQCSVKWLGQDMLPGKCSAQNCQARLCKMCEEAHETGWGLVVKLEKQLRDGPDLVRNYQED